MYSRAAVVESRKLEIAGGIEGCESLSVGMHGKVSFAGLHMYAGVTVMDNASLLKI